MFDGQISRGAGIKIRKAAVIYTAAFIEQSHDDPVHVLFVFGGDTGLYSFYYFLKCFWLGTGKYRELFSIESYIILRKSVNELRIRKTLPSYCGIYLYYPEAAHITLALLSSYEHICPRMVYCFFRKAKNIFSSPLKTLSVF